MICYNCTQFHTIACYRPFGNDVTSTVFETPQHLIPYHPLSLKQNDCMMIKQIDSHVAVG